MKGWWSQGGAKRRCGPGLQWHQVHLFRTYNDVRIWSVLGWVLDEFASKTTLKTLWHELEESRTMYQRSCYKLKNSLQFLRLSSLTFQPNWSAYSSQWDCFLWAVAHRYPGFTDWIRSLTIARRLLGDVPWVPQPYSVRYLTQWRPCPTVAGGQLSKKLKHARSRRSMYTLNFYFIRTSRIGCFGAIVYPTFTPIVPCQAGKLPRNREWLIRTSVLS